MANHHGVLYDNADLQNSGENPFHIRLWANGNGIRTTNDDVDGSNYHHHNSDTLSCRSLATESSKPGSLCKVVYKCVPWKGIDCSYLINFYKIMFQGSIPNPIQNLNGTGELMTTSLPILGISLVVLWVVRSHRRESRIQEIQRSVTESSANGLTNLSLLMAIVTIFLLILAGIVSFSMTKEGGISLWCSFFFPLVPLVSQCFLNYL